jgi:hypothetical protein
VGIIIVFDVAMRVHPSLLRELCTLSTRAEPRGSHPGSRTRITHTKRAGRQAAHEKANRLTLMRSPERMRILPFHRQSGIISSLTSHDFP